MLKTLSPWERVPEGRVRGRPRSEGVANDNALTLTLSRRERGLRLGVGGWRLERLLVLQGLLPEHLLDVDRHVPFHGVAEVTLLVHGDLRHVTRVLDDARG